VPVRKQRGIRYGPNHERLELGSSKCGLSALATRLSGSFLTMKLRRYRRERYARCRVESFISGVCLWGL